MSSNSKIVVTKASGLIEPFSIKKLRNSLERAKASSEEINSIISELLPKLYQGISTKKIYSDAFRLLRNQSKHHAARYYSFLIQYCLPILDNNEDILSHVKIIAHARKEIKDIVLQIKREFGPQCIIL
jgi:transcriptional regulator NrdR family protein